jgi:hypothetical protein
MNHLIAALPADEFIRLKPNLEPVSLSLGEVIYESGEQLEYIFFPTTAIISLLYIMENGSTAEIGMSGNDGLVGIALYGIETLGLDPGIGHFRPPKSITARVNMGKTQISSNLSKRCQLP